MTLEQRIERLEKKMGRSIPGTILQRVLMDASMLGES